MNNEFNEGIDIKPELTFEPFQGEPPLVEVKEEEEKIEDVHLSEEEKKMVDQFVDKIDLNNSNSILQYGVGAQKKIADFSETALDNVRTKDLGEIGDILSNVVYELKNFEDVEEQEGILGLFKKENKITQMKISMLR